MREAVNLLAALAPTLQQTMTTVRNKGYVILDGTVRPIDRSAAGLPYYSGQRKHANTAGRRDAEHRIHDIDFVGTDHICRLNGTRIEAFSRLKRNLYTHLHHGRVNEYRSEIHAL